MVGPIEDPLKLMPTAKTKSITQLIPNEKENDYIAINDVKSTFFTYRRLPLALFDQIRTNPSLGYYQT
ncbi:MAG: hypothetical protein Q9226_003886 [Calogaya cf. arnoldii]